MPGLSFLSKKSWHTSNISNQEKVWIAEQKAESESRRTKELLDQIKAEREGEEFDKLTGRKHNGVSGDRGTNWMYEGGGGGRSGDAGGGTNTEHEAEEARKNEAYLMGKEYVPEGGHRNTGDFAVASTMTGALEKASTYGATIGAGYNNDGNGVAATAGGGGAGGGTTSLRIIQQDPTTQNDAAPLKSDNISIATDNNHQEWNKEFHLRHEDPMFAVHQRRLAQEKDLQKKKRLMERAGLDVQILRRGEGAAAEISTSSTTKAAEMQVERSSRKRDDGNEEDRSDRKHGDDLPKDDRKSRRHKSSRSRRHHHHDDNRAEKKRKRSKRTREAEERHNRRRRHRRSRSPSSSSSSSSSYSSTSSRSASSRPSNRHHQSHRSKNYHDDRKSTRLYYRRDRDRSENDSPPRSEKYNDGGRSGKMDKKDSSRDHHTNNSSGDGHRKSARSSSRSNSPRRNRETKSRGSDNVDDHRHRHQYDNDGYNDTNTYARRGDAARNHDSNNINDKHSSGKFNGKRGFGLVGTTLPPSNSNSFQQPNRKDPSPQEEGSNREQQYHDTSTRSSQYLGPDRQLLESRRAEVERTRQTRLHQARRR